MKRTTKNASRKAQLAVVEHDDHNGLLSHFAQRPELFAPMLNLIASGKQTIDSVMNQAGRAVLECCCSCRPPVSPEREPDVKAGGALAWQSRRTDLPAGEAAQSKQAELVREAGRDVR